MADTSWQTVIQQAQRSANAAAAMARDAQQAAQQANQNYAAIAQQFSTMKQAYDGLTSALKSMQLSRTGGPPSIQYVENIPGRRIPFDYCVDIPIGAGITSVQQGTLTISQEGPFVAVSRYAAFLSAFEFQRTDPTTQAKANFQGRSYGRYRPIHSAWDLNDGLQRAEVVQSMTFPGSGAPHVLSPSNGSPFRSMETDFRVSFKNAGSSFPRQNQEVPSVWWTTQINSPFELGALDVFERGEVMTFDILPLHANNPAFGNISGFGLPNMSFPFLASGWDYLEGINDENDVAAQTTDPIVRLPNGILTIGFHGYRIVQPAGSGPY